MLKININSNQNEETLIEYIKSAMKKIKNEVRRGSKMHIKLLRNILIQSGYKSSKRLEKAIGNAKNHVQYTIVGDKWSKMDEVDYLEFLIKIRTGVMKPMNPMAVPSGVNPMAVSHLMTGVKAPDWVIDEVDCK